MPPDPTPLKNDPSLLRKVKIFTFPLCFSSFFGSFSESKVDFRGQNSGFDLVVAKELKKTKAHDIRARSGLLQCVWPPARHPESVC